MVQSRPWYKRYMIQCGTNWYSSTQWCMVKSRGVTGRLIKKQVQDRKARTKRHIEAQLHQGWSVTLVI